jgi:hypothetical protein
LGGLFNFMGVITKTKTWADAETVNYTDINANFDSLFNEVNGGLDNDNIDSSAGIESTKISGTAVTLSGAQTITGVKTFNTATKQKLTTDTDGSTITFDLDASNIHSVTLGGNRTLALSNADTGQVFVIRLVQDGTGSRTVTWFSTIKWSGGVAPTLTTTVSKTDVFGFICTGENTYDGFVIGQNL